MDALMHLIYELIRLGFIHLNPWTSCQGCGLWP